MPTLSHITLPVPQSWDEFEDIVTSSIHAQSPSIAPQRFGRSGQKQDGVDIFFEDYTSRRTGVQCKLVNEFTFKEFEAEVGKADSFQPPLESYIIALATQRDAHLQKQVYALSTLRATSSKFRVGVWFWEDIAFHLSRDPAALARHYPQMFSAATAPPAPAAGVMTELLQRRMKAFEEIWDFHHRCLPPRRHPDAEWDEALEDIALSLDSHTKAIQDMLARLGPILPPVVAELLGTAATAAEDGMFEVSLSGSFEVPSYACKAAERMYDALTRAVDQLRQSLESGGVRFA
jgi:hypothetical protein